MEDPYSGSEAMRLIQRGVCRCPEEFAPDEPGAGNARSYPINRFDHTVRDAGLTDAVRVPDAGDGRGYHVSTTSVCEEASIDRILFFSDAPSFLQNQTYTHHATRGLWEFQGRHSLLTTTGLRHPREEKKNVLFLDGHVRPVARTGEMTGDLYVHLGGN
jgi:prepilin-type processing-associated H-X9-DG protein